MAGTEITYVVNGTDYVTYVPELTENANIEVALAYVYGGLNAQNTPYTFQSIDRNSILGQIINLQEQLDVGGTGSGGGKVQDEGTEPDGTPIPPYYRETPGGDQPITDGWVFVYSGTNQNLQYKASAVFNDIEPTAPLSNGLLWINPSSTVAPYNLSGYILEPNTPATVGFTTKAATGQTANLQEWRNSSNAIVSYVDASGAINAASTVLQSPAEKVTVSATAATGTVTYDCSVQTVLYYTSDATGNWTLNFTNNNLAEGESLTIAFLATQGATAYYASAFQIDGVVVTPKWANGASPTSGNTNSIDLYTFTIIKIDDTPTYTVLGSLVGLE